MGWRPSRGKTRDLTSRVGTEGKAPQTSLFHLSQFHQNFTKLFKPLIAYSVLPKFFFAPPQNWNVATNSEDKINIPDVHPCSGETQVLLTPLRSPELALVRSNRAEDCGGGGEVIFKRLLLCLVFSNHTILLYQKYSLKILAAGHAISCTSSFSNLEWRLPITLSNLSLAFQSYDLLLLLCLEVLHVVQLQWLIYNCVKDSVPYTKQRVNMLIFLHSNRNTPVEPVTEIMKL